FSFGLCVSLVLLVRGLLVGVLGSGLGFVTFAIVVFLCFSLVVVGVVWGGFVLGLRGWWV
ncbi:hypothetical protein RA269_28450, partial [Pseudomonas syringae pv. tagetis]|uniref:hypothetical protein n=1 Tax=Pseudomonas syringae group genomosp. 7 TaxID=251699 RepID=UPI00376FB2A1